MIVGWLEGIAWFILGFAVAELIRHARRRAWLGGDEWVEIAPGASTFIRGMKVINSTPGTMRVHVPAKEKG